MIVLSRFNAVARWVQTDGPNGGVVNALAVRGTGRPSPRQKGHSRVLPLVQVLAGAQVSMQYALGSRWR